MKAVRAYLLVGILLATAGAETQGTEAQIPALHGTVLSGAKVDLPEALKGKAGVLVLGFSEASRNQVAVWGRRLAGDYRESQSVVYYEMPMLESAPRFLRGYILRKIGESVPEPAKARFLPVVDHEAEWKKLAGYAKADDAYVLVVDGEGNVRWKTSGAVDEERYAAVKRELERIR
jgi:hypothetical protein